MFKCCVCNKKTKKVKASSELAEKDTGKENAITPFLKRNEDDRTEGDIIAKGLNGDVKTEANAPMENVTVQETVPKGSPTKKESTLGKFVDSDALLNVDPVPDQTAKKALSDGSLEENQAVGKSTMVSPVKSHLYGGSAGYIERTVDDGPEEEGDDSVFEAGPPSIESDVNKKELPGCETEDREEQLEELVTRLENVTRRLEKVPTQAQTQETAVQTKTPSPKKPTPVVSVSPVKMSVAGFEDILAGPVKQYLQLSQKIGGDVATHSKLVEKAFQVQLQYIQTAASRPIPSNQSEQVALLAPTSAQIQEIQEFREKNRGSPLFNHLSAISESIPALGWVAVSPTPAPYVKEMNDAGQFYTNRVLKEWKEKDKNHVEWCKTWVQTLSDLQQYVRQNHTTGLVWAKGAPTGAPGLPPPPPPPCMPVGEVAANLDDDRNALFAQINQGENITKSLKKVTSEMQTHKNPSLRTGPAPFKAPAVQAASGGRTAPSIPAKTTLPANAPIDKPPVFTRDGKKWIVEYQKGNKNLVVEGAEMNNVVYMYRCQDSTLVVKGKINSIVMDSCRKSSVVFDSLVSSIEFVNCQSIQMQVLGKVPTISIDKTDGCQMYLSPESLNVELITSKSSEMNVMVPKGSGDYTEYPVPEQFKTTISPKGLSTTAVDSLG